MKSIVFVVATVLALLLQTKVSIFGAAPALTVLLACYAGITGGTTKGMAAGSILGIIEDGISGGMIGPNLLGKGMAGFFSSYISGGVFRWTPLLGMLALFIFTVMDGFAVFLSRGIYETLPSSPGRMVLTLATQATLNAFAGIFMKPKGTD